MICALNRRHCPTTDTGLRGIWALIQATISQIDFNYAKYAETRLGEYWAWRGEMDGTREQEGKELPLRERRWAQEA